MNKNALSSYANREEKLKNHAWRMKTSCPQDHETWKDVCLLIIVINHQTVKQSISTWDSQEKWTNASERARWEKQEDKPDVTNKTWKNKNREMLARPWSISSLTCLSFSTSLLIERANRKITSWASRLATHDARKFVPLQNLYKHSSSFSRLSL